jgi:hypothetical protein
MYVKVHVRGGTIHTEQFHNGKTSEEMWDTPLTVVAALCEKGFAEGTLVVVCCYIKIIFFFF